MQQGDREPSISELIDQLKQVRIQEARIIAQIERVNRQGPAEQSVDYQVGDRIRITNGVKGTRATTGTVTRVGDEDRDRAGRRDTHLADQEESRAVVKQQPSTIFVHPQLRISCETSEKVDQFNEAIPTPPSIGSVCREVSLQHS